jgi:hypothetical protein
MGKRVKDVMRDKKNTEDYSERDFATEWLSDGSASTRSKPSKTLYSQYSQAPPSTSKPAIFGAFHTHNSIVNSSTSYYVSPLPYPTCTLYVYPQYKHSHYTVNNKFYYILIPLRTSERGYIETFDGVGTISFQNYSLCIIHITLLNLIMTVFFMGEIGKTVDIIGFGSVGKRLFWRL